jgi:hypothetical protein
LLDILQVDQPCEEGIVEVDILLEDKTQERVEVDIPEKHLLESDKGVDIG